MGSLDFSIVLVYLVGLFVISTLAAARNTGQREMFSANRNSPWWASGLSGFMTVFSANTFVVWGGIAYQLGLVAVVINLTYGIAAMLVGYFVAGQWNRMGVDTPAEYVTLRFGETGLNFFTWTLLLKRILGVAGSLYALGVLLTARTSDGSSILPLQPHWAIILFGLIVILYTMQGGLWAVLMTDVLQFIVLTVVVFVASILMMADLGSFANFQNNLPDGFLHLTNGEYTWFFLIGWTTINFFTFGAEWAFVQRFIAVKNPRDARKATWLFGIMYLVTPLFWMLPPLLYRAQVEGADKEAAYILATQSVLPAGLVGLMVTALFSATASMVSSQLNVFAGVLTNDFYRPLFNPQATEKNLVLAGRFFTGTIGILLIVMALLVPWMGGAEKVIVTINSMLVVPLLAPTLWGVFSKKIGIGHLLTVALTSFAIGMFLRFGMPFLTEEGDALWFVTEFVVGNKKMVELFNGVLLPVCMLGIFELTLSTQDRGAKMLETVCGKSITEDLSNSTNTRFDPFPARMVMVTLLLLGAWITFIGLREPDARTVLLSVGCLLLALGGSLECFIRSRMTAAAHRLP
ncbi:MAG: Na+:solute symporter [Planctomycetota bacterium]|nr:Na+:solute symporter [Planctomycetota bacterium]